MWNETVNLPSKINGYLVKVMEFEHLLSYQLYLTQLPSSNYFNKSAA